MKMITNVIKELCHYTPEYWRYALVNELVYIFSKRLVTLDEEHIFLNNINALLPINYKNDVSMVSLKIYSLKINSFVFFLSQ